MELVVMAFSKEPPRTNSTNSFFTSLRDATFKHQLSEDEAASLYTDSILAFIENIRNKRFEGKSAVKTIY